MQRGSRQSFKLIRILRTAETPLTTAEIVERMGRNPRNRTHTEAVKKLLQRAVGRDAIQRVVPGVYTYEPKAEKPKPHFEVSWASAVQIPGAITLDFGIPRQAHLPTREEDRDEGRIAPLVRDVLPGPGSAPPLPENNFEEILSVSERQLDDAFFQATGRHLFGSEEWQQKVDAIQEKQQQQNGHKWTWENRHRP